MNTYPSFTGSVAVNMNYLPYCVGCNSKDFQQCTLKFSHNCRILKHKGIFSCKKSCYVCRQQRSITRKKNKAASAQKKVSPAGDPVIASGGVEPHDAPVAAAAAESQSQDIPAGAAAAESQSEGVPADVAAVRRDRDNVSAATKSVKRPRHETMSGYRRFRCEAAKMKKHIQQYFQL